MSKEKSPRILVAALIYNPKSRCLLLTRHAGSQRWHFPDGEFSFHQGFVHSVYEALKDDLQAVVNFVHTNQCMPIVTRDANILTLHFVVDVHPQSVFLPKTGLEFGWFPKDSWKDNKTFEKQVLPSTFEVFCRLAELNLFK
jgi:hypothetical protein